MDSWRPAPRNFQTPGDTRSYPATQADSACRQALDGKFRHLEPTGALAPVHPPPFAPGALFSSEHMGDISGAVVTEASGLTRRGSKTIEGQGNFGCNAQTAEYGDLMEMGVVDPTKVARCALQNAASVAGLILTTDAMVAELPSDEHSHGGGMGGMDM